MLDLHHLTTTTAQRLKGLLFDLDDTLLTAGALTEEAYSALFRLRESGLELIAVTGRPASWAELCARLWPLSAAVAENGAMTYERLAERTLLVDSARPEARKERRERLLQLVTEARQRMPDLVPADDVGGRISDFTFDIGEHERASEELIAQARAFAHDRGAVTSRSSVHLHYSFDRTDKASGVLHYLSARGFDSTCARQLFAYVGDSQNDASCFAAFETAVGVRNLRGTFSLPPRFRTRAESGAGFCELAERLCSLRQAPRPGPASR